jgi:acyl transferase domain-containing protein
VGEYVAACVAGVYTLEEGLRRFVAGSSLPERFADDARLLAEQGCSLLLEVGPSSCEPRASARAGLPLLTSLQQGKDDWQVLLSSLAQLYVA